MITVTHDRVNYWIEQLKAKGCKYHHTAAKRGYVSRRTAGKIEEYHGKYGTGYTWSYPRWDTTSYCYVEYWLKGGI